MKTREQAVFVTVKGKAHRAMRVIQAVLLLFLASVVGAQAVVKTETVMYTVDGVTMRGYLAYPEGLTERCPGILVVHEWMGLDGHAKRRAKQLAEMGYVALAADMYGEGKTAKGPAEAGEWSGALKRGDRATMRTRAAGALDFLRADSRVDLRRLGAIGYCFGGTVVLELARGGADLRAAVSFHGGLDTVRPAEAGKIRAALLVCHGADDPHVSKMAIEAFHEEMRRSNADWQMVFYGGAVHGFSNPASGDDPSKGVAYNALADRRAWDLMKSFFRERFVATSD